MIQIKLIRESIIQSRTNGSINESIQNYWTNITNQSKIDQESIKVSLNDKESIRKYQ